MKAEKIRDLGDHELAVHVADVEDRLFRLRFQMSMGQTDGLKKYHELKKDRARMLTVQRERELAQQKQEAAQRGQA
ncbi:MAG: 50S ribosomal protein L29 [Acidobacteria bacterium]|nr:50S ribosomal protein L29 [Acidobacteriota bacterium]